MKIRFFRIRLGHIFPFTICKRHKSHQDQVERFSHEKNVKQAGLSNLLQSSKKTAITLTWLVSNLVTCIFLALCNNSSFSLTISASMFFCFCLELNIMHSNIYFLRFLQIIFKIKQSFGHINCNCVFARLRWSGYRKLRDLVVFMSSCHLPICLPHTVEV